MNSELRKILRYIALICLMLGILMFFIGATTGTVTGYKDANGKYYSNPGSRGSNEGLCIPGLLIAAADGFVLFWTPDPSEGQEKSKEKAASTPIKKAESTPIKKA